MISLQQTLFSMVKTESIPPKIKNKTRLSTFITIIQHSSGSPSYSNQRKRNKMNPDWKRRSKALTVSKWHDTVHEWVSEWSLSGMSDSVTPWTIAHQAPPTTGFSRQEYWSGLSFPSPRNLPTPGTELGSLTWQADSLPLGHHGSPLSTLSQVKHLHHL